MKAVKLKDAVKPSELARDKKDHHSVSVSYLKQKNQISPVHISATRLVLRFLAEARRLLLRLYRSLRALQRYWLSDCESCSD